MTADARTVLVLKPSSLGDIVHTLPAVARLRQRRPGWRVRWLVNPEFAPLLEGNPAVDEIIHFPRASFRGPMAPVRVGRWLGETWRRQPPPDLALDFQGLLRSALLGRLSGARALHGLADAREGAALFYRHTVAPPAGPVHAVRRYLALVDGLLGTLPGGGEDDVRFPLPPGEPWSEALPAGFILLHPFARGEGKSLSPAQVGAFCRALAPRPVVLVGRGGGPPGPLPAGVINLLDRTTLTQLMGLLRHAHFVVSVDSGPMHLAAAALPDPGRLVALHAWTDPRRVGPFPPGASVWKSGRLWRVGDLPGEGNVELLTRPGNLETGFGPGDLRAVCQLIAAGPG